MPRKIYICVNGIYNSPGNPKGITDRIVTWIHTNTDHRAEKFEYLCGAITRRVTWKWPFFNAQTQRARALAELINSYKGDEIYLIGHSNGCEIICRALEIIAHVEIYHAHLIAPATDANFKKNGLNRALKDYRVRKVFLYIADKDRAMRFASFTGKALKLIGLGYGTLGLKGAENVSRDVTDRVEAIHFKEFHHSTFFEEQNFNGLMRSIVDAE